MKRLIYFILTVCCGLAVMSCKHNENSITEPEFHRNETLTHELMSLQRITNPMRLEISHPFLIIQNRGRNDSLFHIYDLRNGELTSVFGRRGQGPDDFLTPWLQNTQTPGFLISERSRVHHFVINEEGTPHLNTKTNIQFMGGVLNSSFINDTLFVTDAWEINSDLLLLSVHDELPQKTYPFRTPSGMRDPNLDTNSAFISANEKRVVLFYNWQKRIDILDTDLDLVKSIQFDFPRSRRITPQNMLDVRGAFILGYVGEKYIYALFRGISLNEFMADPHKHNNTLYVFDLDGNPVVSFELDGIGIGHFVVNEETFTLYGIPSGQIIEDHLVVFQLTGLGQ